MVRSFVWEEAGKVWLILDDMSGSEPEVENGSG